MSAPESDVFKVEQVQVEGGIIAIGTINRPNKMNALNQDVMASIRAFTTWAESNDDVRCVVFTGASPLEPEEGKRAKPNSFVAGADISEFVGKGSHEIRPIFSDFFLTYISDLSEATLF